MCIRDSIYGMDVIEIPTNKPVARIDYDDAVYMTKKEKFRAVVEAVSYTHLDVYKRQEYNCPEIMLLGRGMKNDTTVIAGWSAISCIRNHVYIRDGARCV